MQRLACVRVRDLQRPLSGSAGNQVLGLARLAARITSPRPLSSFAATEARKFQPHVPVAEAVTPPASWYTAAEMQQVGAISCGSLSETPALIKGQVHSAGTPRHWHAPPAPWPDTTAHFPLPAVPNPQYLIRPARYFTCIILPAWAHSSSLHLDLQPACTVHPLGKSSCFFPASGISATPSPRANACSAGDRDRV